MNNAFTKKKKIELDLNWSITPDGYNGVVLTFAEEGKKEKVIIEKALSHYANHIKNDSTSLEELSVRCDKVTEIISNIDREFKQF